MRLGWDGSLARVGVYALALPLVLFATLFSFLFNKGNKKPQPAPERSASGAGGVTPATATVLEVGDSTNTSAGELKTSLRLQIDPESGPSYEALTIWHIQPAHASDVQLGKKLAIKIDQKNPQVIYPDDSLDWASQRDGHPVRSENFYGLSRNIDRGTAARMVRATPASAKIIQVGNSYNMEHWGTSVSLRLEVAPPGGSPYQIISVWEVQPPFLDQIKAGNTLAIKIDAQNPKVIFPAAAWARQMYLKEYTEDDMEN